MHICGLVVSLPCDGHKVHGSNPEVMHIFSKTRFFAKIPAYTSVYFDILLYTWYILVYTVYIYRDVRLYPFQIMVVHGISLEFTEYHGMS
jgi:hypothetical protein